MRAIINKKLIFPILLIFVIFVVGCGSYSSQSKVSDIDVFTGTQGLIAEFAKTAPPQRVFEESNFPILLRIRNIGAYSIPQEAAFISLGVEKDYITELSVEDNNKVVGTGEGNEARFWVEGKTKINSKGDEIIVAFNAKAGKLEPQSESKDSTITANLCYRYMTPLSTTICIDPDIGNLKPVRKVCDVKELIFNNGQGAPIAITKIEPQMVPEGELIKPQFLIYVENRGIGNSVHPSKYHTSCGSGGQEPKDQYRWNVAFLKAYSSGNEELECNPNLKSVGIGPDENAGFIRFIDKKDFVRCTFKKGIPRNSDAYTSPLRIEIDYGYVQTIATNLIIQKSLKY